MGIRTCESLFPFSHRDLPESAAEWGYVYAMSNAAFEGLLKIGFSTRSPIERMKELDRQTANPGKFVPEFWFRIRGAQGHETKIFEALAYLRIRSDKEFFRVETPKLALYLSWYFERDPDFLQVKHAALYKTLKGASQGVA